MARLEPECRGRDIALRCPRPLLRGRNEFERRMFLTIRAAPLLNAARTAQRAVPTVLAALDIDENAGPDNFWPGFRLAGGRRDAASLALPVAADIPVRPVPGLYARFHLKFDPSRDNLVGAGKTYHQNFLKFKKEFPAQDDLVVVVESESPEKNRQFVERLGAKLVVETNLFTDVLYRNDLKMLGRKALLFVPETNLVELRETLTNYLPFIQRFTQATNLDSMFGMVNSQILNGQTRGQAQPQAMVALIKAMPMLDRISREATVSLQHSGTPPSPGLSALFGAGDEDIYITFESNRIYLVTAQAPREELNDAALERLRELVAQTEREVPGLNVGITGESVLEHDEMAQSQHDSIVASIVSLVVCALIFIYGYQQTGRPLKATFCLLVGLGYTLAFTAFTVGHLNILTITFMPILIGLAIDFGVHLITRYEEELRLGRSEEEAMRTAMVFTGQGVFTGALTTAVAFLAMGLTQFQGIQEMGVICGGGMLICLVPMLTLLPVLLFRGTQNSIDHQQAGKPVLRARLENLWLQRPVWVSIIAAVLCGLSLMQFKKVHFDYDLLNMQANGLPAVVFEKKLVQSQSVLFAAVIADSAEQAAELEKRIRKLPSVAEGDRAVDSMASHLVGDQSKQLQLIRQIKQDIAGIHFAPADRSPVILTNLSSTLYGTEGFLGAAADYLEHEEVPGFYRRGDHGFGRSRGQVENTRNQRPGLAISGRRTFEPDPEPVVRHQCRGQGATGGQTAG